MPRQVPVSQAGKNTLLAGNLRSGVTVVIVVDPDDRAISIYRRSSPPVVLSGADAELEVGDLIPGFSCPLDQIFK